jgi:hypothetical protein
MTGKVLAHTLIVTMDMISLATTKRGREGQETVGRVTGRRRVADAGLRRVLVHVSSIRRVEPLT